MHAVALDTSIVAERRASGDAHSRALVAPAMARARRRGRSTRSEGGTTGAAARPAGRLAAGDAERLAASLEEPVLLCARDGRVRWTNSAAVELGVAAPGMHVAASRGDAQMLVDAFEQAAGRLADGHGHYGRVAVGAGPAELTLRRTGDFLAALVRIHPGTDDALGEALRTRYGCTRSEIRLALQVRAGVGTGAGAVQEGVAPATVRWRLHRLYATLGQRSRVGLLRFLDQLAASVRSPRVPVPLALAARGEVGGTCALALGRLLTHAEPALATLSDAGDLDWVSSGAHAVLACAARQSRGRGPTARAAALRRAVTSCRGLDAAGPPRTIRLDSTTTALLWRRRPRLVIARLAHAPLPWRALAWRLRCDVGLSVREALVAGRIGLGQDTASVAASLGLAESTVRSLASRVGEWSGVEGRAGLADLVRRLRCSGDWPA
jgi:DNA-binding CsgD family transcriptional regulator